MDKIKFLRVTSTLILTFIGLTAADPAPAANILLNPGFETGGLSSWITIGWGAGGIAHSGISGAVTGCVGATCITTSMGSFAQTVATTVSQSYSLSFWFANDGAPGNHLRVLANGVILSDLIDQPGDSVFRQVLLSFVATSASTTIEFRGRNDPAGVYVDDVCLDVSGGTCGGGGAVPEPGTWATAGAALMAVAALSRRLRR